MRYRLNCIFFLVLLLKPVLALASGDCPTTAMDIYENSKAVLMVESLSVRMDSDEFYSVFYGDDLSYEEKEKYNKNWWEYSKANSDAHFLIKKVYKGPVSVDDILIVDGALAEFDFKPSVDYIVFLEPRAAKNPYHIDTCLVVEYSDSLLRWYGYSGSDIDFPWYDKKYFKLLVNGLDGAAIGDHRKAYLESTKVPKIVMEIKEITERKSTKSAQDIEVR